MISYHTKFGSEKNQHFRRYSRRGNILNTYEPCDLDHEDNKAIFPQDTPAHHYTKFGYKTFNCFIV